MVVGIHQPNFLPWLGYFHKMALSDLFVLFDDVQFPRAKSFVNRVLIKTHNGELWMTVPIGSKGDLLKINEVQISEQKWKHKYLKTINLNYKRAPYFKDYFDEFEAIFLNDYSKLVDLNFRLIEWSAGKLKLNTKLVFSSDLGIAPELTGEAKIMSILKKTGATTYVSGKGKGSERYLVDEDFKKENIKLIWQEFLHPQYPQLHGDFISYLSVLDLLFNCGEKSIDVLLGKRES